MKIHEGIEQLKGFPHAVVTSGTFDGVHLGHQKIIQRLKEVAQKIDGETVLITFWPHPRFVLQKDADDLRLLSTFEEKADLLASFGIDHLVKITFTKEFSNWTSDQFIQHVLLEAIKTEKLVIGYDHHFGKNREGSFEYLRDHADEFGFGVEEIPKQEIEDVGISSTKIRKALFEGRVKDAAQFLGRNYSVHGKVVRGDQIGRELGYPTANIAPDASYKLIPANGSYAVKTHLDGKTYDGMLYIGPRPTLPAFDHRIEVHLFNFSSDIYDEELALEFIEHIRGDDKFESMEALKKQIEEDEKVAKKILNP